MSEISELWDKNKVQEANKWHNLTHLQRCDITAGFGLGRKSAIDDAVAEDMSKHPWHPVSVKVPSELMEQKLLLYFDGVLGCETGWFTSLGEFRIGRSAWKQFPTHWAVLPAKPV